MKIISINLGRPKTINWKGKTVTTAIFKEPVEGPVKVGFLSLEGDQQADLRVHGGKEKAIYAYPTIHYSFWEKELGKNPLPYGLFGQNLDIDGEFLEDQIFVGDIFRIGNVELMAMTPRLPCMKLGAKLGNALYIKIFTQAQRSGVYFKVLKEGKIKSNDLVEKLESNTNSISILELFKLSTTEKNNFFLLEKAIDSNHLPLSWRDNFLQAVAAKTSR